MSQMPQIHFIQIGGTIDKDYPQNPTNHGYNFEIRQPAYLTILERIHFPLPWSHETLFQKDSLDLTPDDRMKIFERVSSLDIEHIIITHGTDTIRETASTLSALTHKTIILTGSVLPHKFKDTDADFNLGMAIGAILNIENGVYIALNGAVVPWHEYRPS